MPAGKVAAQAGHAFLEGFLASPDDLRRDYRADGIGTKVVLTASLPQILSTLDRARWLGIPAALIEDSGHVMPPHFDGAPIVTALGIGLDPRAPTLVRRFSTLDNPNRTEAL